VVTSIFAAQARICYECGMPASTDPPVRKTVSLPASVWKQVEDFQFSHRIKRETEAMRRLIQLGLAAAKTSGSGSPI
jgi:hypothetical protein